MPSEAPPRTSPQYESLKSPRPQHVPRAVKLDLDQEREDSVRGEDAARDERTSPPPSLLSPAFTPPSTPGSQTPWPLKRSKSIPVDSSTEVGHGPRLMEALPEVECVVRARIPTTTGQEMFLHLYTNSMDSKEHLAIVFGPHIRSRSLDRERPGETEMDRMIRGAYTGRLYPGRTTSKVDEDSEATDQTTPSGSKDPGPLASSSPLASLKASLRSVTSLNETSSKAIQPANPPLVRIHSECYTGETVWSARCDCGEQLDEAARLMSLPDAINTPNTLSMPPSPTASSSASSTTGRDTNPGGVIIYLRQEGRGIGLGEKLKAYNLQDLGSDTVEANLLLRHPADARTYGLATSMLVDLGLGGENGIRLLTNNPDKVRAVEGPEREIVVRERVAMVPLAWKTGGKAGIRSAEVESYLKTKIEQFGHMIGYS